MAFSKVHDEHGDPLPCGFPECDGFMQTKGLCRSHYQQQRLGKELTPIERRAPVLRCQADQCNRSVNYGGYCVGHRKQVERGEEPHALLVGKSPNRLCSFPECGRMARNSGLCDSHADQRRKGRELTPIREKGEWVLCPVPRCGREMNPFYNMCTKHRTRAKHYGLTWDEGFKLFSRQHCDACGDLLRQGTIDHDHSCCPGEGSCGKCVRGVLCGSCNKMLGYARDDPERLQAAISYLRRVRREMVLAA